MIEYAVFDLDGTLLDTSEGIIGAAIYTMHQYGLPAPEKSEYKKLIGPPIQDTFQKLYGLSNEAAMDMANVFRDFYKTDQYLFMAEPYEGIYELFETLVKTGIKVGVATYKREDYAVRLLREKGFDKYTRYMFGADFEGKLKKSDIIRSCLSQMGCTDYSKAVYIGDSKSDGIGANTVQIPFIAVTYGFGFASAKDAGSYHPIAVAANPSCLGKWITGGVIHGVC